MGVTSYKEEEKGAMKEFQRMRIKDEIIAVEYLPTCNMHIIAQ